MATTHFKIVKDGQPKFIGGTDSTTRFLRGDGTLAIPVGGEGGGQTTGTTAIDFGAAPGKTDASVAVTDQADIVAGSIVQAWLRPVATADHSADEHMIESLKVFAGNIVAGTGFTIYGHSTWIGGGQQSHNIYGLWNVAWAWS